MKQTKQNIIIGGIIISLISIIMAAMVLLGGMLSILVSVLNPVETGQADKDVHVQALQAVSAEYNPENTIDVYLIKVIDLFHNAQLTMNQQSIEQFIITYFLLELEREVEVTSTDEHGETVTHTKIEIYYLYKSFYELVATIRAAPFLFGDGAVSAIVHLSMSGLTLGGGSNGSGNPNMPDGGGGSGGSGGALVGRYPAPIPNARITCLYGGRINPISGKTEFHNALDMQGAWHSPVSTIADGVVTSINTLKSPYGNFIVIKHELPEETFYTKYAHLSAINVSVGQTVSQGDTIGIEGGDPVKDPNPGWSTGHHLHLEIWTNTGHVNPADYIY